MKWLLSHVLFAGTMFFAAGTDALAGVGDGGFDAGLEGGDTGGADSGGAGDGAAAAVGDADPTAEPDAARPAAQRPPVEKEEPEAAEFKGQVSARILALKKQAPELAAVFQKYPDVQAKFEATMRRDSAYRECFPTVAEARQIRERLPNGLQDLAALTEDVTSLEKIDKSFYSKNPDGTYPGHGELLANMFSEDREAAVNLFKTLPKEWAKLDPQSYNQVMSQIVGATIAHAQLSDMPMLDYIAEMHDAAKEAGNAGLQNGLSKLWHWANNYVKGGEGAKPSADQEKLTRERQEFERTKLESAKGDGQKFHTGFVTESRKVQNSVIEAHPAMQKFLKAPGLTPDKRSKVTLEIRSKMEKFLEKSPSFMRQLRPAYEARNLQSSLDLQKAAWSQPWLLNRMVREVLSKETSAMVSNNRETALRRGAKPAAAAPRVATAPTKPYQDPSDKRWYHPNGRPMSMQEILQGKHLG